MTQNNLKIAVTGGIGSGKSEVCSIIKRAGFPVFSCDEIYFELLNSGTFDNDLKNTFGEQIYIDGRLDKSKLSSIVFENKVELEKLNKITHPKILDCALNRMKAQKVCFLEVPLLFESGFEGLFDGVIVVLRHLNDRIESVVKRSGISTKEAILRIKSQFDYENNDFTKYYVIHNNSNLKYLSECVEEILKDVAEKLK
ncbi:MAG: dephospho-CoA kinase [Clostridiales bacterium]|nr:dephospho-CoA kinase [Clostridiales bacterium]